MTSELFAKSAVILVLILLCALGVWHNDKMVAFEEWLLDRAAYITAMVIVSYRTAKRKFIVWMIHVHFKLLRCLLESDKKYAEKHKEGEHNATPD